jgi:hypothetical protein
VGLGLEGRVVLAREGAELAIATVRPRAVPYGFAASRIAG